MITSKRNIHVTMMVCSLLSSFIFIIGNNNYRNKECKLAFKDGEEEAEWLRTAGLGQLTEAWKAGREVLPDELGAALRPLSRVQAEAVRRRVKSLNHTVKQRFNQRQRVRKPDIRDVFKDIEVRIIKCIYIHRNL